MVMSSIMRRRRGLTASLLMGAPVRDGGGPMIFGQATPDRSPHLQYWPPLPRERFSPMTICGSSLRPLQGGGYGLEAGRPDASKAIWGSCPPPLSFPHGADPRQSFRAAMGSGALFHSRPRESGVSPPPPSHKVRARPSSSTSSSGFANW